MKDIKYHFGNEYIKDTIFEFPYFVHFGDQITCINLIKNLQIDSFKINPKTNHGRELCSYFFDESIFTDDSPTHYFYADPDLLTESYKCTYKKLNNNHLKREKQYITYSFDSICDAVEKTPPYLSDLIIKLEKKYTKDRVIEVGSNIGISKTIEYITNSFVFVGIDNGASHLTRCTDTPLIMMKHFLDVRRAFPPEYYSYDVATSLNDVLNLVEKYV